MKILPTDQLKPFINSYNILIWEKNSPNIYLPAWTNNFLFFKYGDNSDVELQNGKYLTGYDTMVTGCMTYALRFVDKHISAAMIAVEFKPLSLYYFLKKDISFLTNLSHYGDDIFPGASHVMNEIKKTEVLKERIDLIDKFLTKHFHNIQYIKNSMIDDFFQCFDDSILDEKNLSIQSLADNHGISEKQYRRIFQKMIGITPKLYYRIKRLEYILQELHNEPDQKYLNILRGYVDQSHFIKDFVRFTGQKPSELQKFFKDIKLRKIYNYL
jgi:AraC-like DNA-binding protein